DVVRGELEDVAEHQVQGSDQVALGRRDALEALVGVGHRVGDDHEQAVLLGLEVVVERGRPDADVGRDVGPLGVLVAVAPEALGRRGEDLRPFAAQRPAAASLLIRTHLESGYQFSPSSPNLAEWTGPNSLLIA